MEIILSRVKSVLRAGGPARALAVMGVAALVALRCSDAGAPPSQGPARAIASDQELFTLVKVASPFVEYPLFPGVDSVASGTLNGSGAHQPLVRVSLNTPALGSLTSDTLQSGTAFARGSVIVKEIREGGVTTLLAVMAKEPGSPEAAGGWLWAEYEPGGTVVASILARGAGCVPCHSREQGPRNDLVRTFERRRP